MTIGVLMGQWYVLHSMKKVTAADGFQEIRESLKIWPGDNGGWAERDLSPRGRISLR
jgi:hypothetical protein